MIWQVILPLAASVAAVSSRLAGRSGLSSLVSTRQVVTSPPVLAKTMAGVNVWPLTRVTAVAAWSAGATTIGGGAITVRSIKATAEPCSFSAMMVMVTAPSLDPVGVPVI